MKENRVEVDQGKYKRKMLTIDHKQISIRLPKEMLTQIESFGEAEKRNRNNMIEWLLREALRQKGGGK